jgi:hypothetical protein
MGLALVLGLANGLAIVAFLTFRFSEAISARPERMGLRLELDPGIRETELLSFLR